MLEMVTLKEDIADLTCTYKCHSFVEKIQQDSKGCKNFLG